MKRFAAITLCIVLFSTAFAVGGGEEQKPRWADSLRSVYLYTEGIKQRAIVGDTMRAATLFRKAIEADSLFAPAYYELVLSRSFSSPEEGVELARRAYRLDTTNRWYHRLYGQMLLMTSQYEEALPLFEALNEVEREPDNYRILAALYEQVGRPYSAISMLDSAEMHFGRNPYLSRMKRQLLTRTNQIDRAIEEAEKALSEGSYEAEAYTNLAELYAMGGKDSLARSAYNKALAIDSMHIETLMSLSDFFSAKGDFRSMLWVTGQLFKGDDMPLEMKVDRFELLTSDIDFYRKHYMQLNNLAQILSVRYPNEPKVIKLYAGHLIASGEMERALDYYKLHLADRPAQRDYYDAVIEIESYLQRPDSALRYLDRATELFPEEQDYPLMRGQIYYQMKEYDRAVKAYKKVLKKLPNDSLRSVVWGNIGDIRHAQTEQEWPGLMLDKMWRKECYDAYKKALKYNPDNIMVLNNWAYFLALEGEDLERALAMSARVQELTDKNPTYMDTHAWILFRMGRLEEARPILRQAIALDGHRSAELLVHYGDVLHALGEQYLAETYWKRALDKGYNKAEIERRLAQPPITKSH